METKFKSFDVKADAISEDGGSITGYASTFDREPDSYGDVVAKGAFAKSLARWAEKGARIPFLFGHRTDDPKYNIGWCEAEEDERGLRFTAYLDAESERAQYVRKLYKEGRIYQFSFAYAVLDAAPVELEGGVQANELRELDLFEISAVQIPANQHAEVIDVKEWGGETVYVFNRDMEHVPANGIDARDMTPERAGDAILAMLGMKAGRRNSAKDADELKSIADHARAIQSIVNGLLADEQGDEPKAAEAEANAEEPSEANAEELQAKEAERDDLLQQAREILGKEA